MKQLTYVNTIWNLTAFKARNVLVSILLRNSYKINIKSHFNLNRMVRTQTLHLQEYFVYISL